MEFFQKLEYLLQFTKTTDNLLASYISLDATYFSRLRTCRKLHIKDDKHIRAMASFFAFHCVEKRQKEKLLSAMNKSNELVHDPKMFEDLIFQWLSKDVLSEGSQDQANFGHASAYSLNEIPLFKNRPDLATNVPIISGTEVYYGNNGRRNASIQVLCEILKLPEPCTLLMLSEENIEWMTESPDYMATWTALLQQAILRGNKIKIVHHIRRDTDDMIVAIKHWLPLYMSGMVEAYYNPKVREIFFRRTLFVAPGCAAIFSNSVAGGATETANFLAREKKAIEAAVSEFEDYLSFCQPLFHIYGEDKIYERRKSLEVFDAEKAETFLKTNSLSDLPIPAEAIELSTRCLDADKRDHIISLHQKRTKILEELLSQNNFHIILDEPDCKTYNKRLNPLVYSGLECQNEPVYTDEIIRLQLKYLKHLLKNNENFHIYLSENKDRTDHVIYGKVNVGGLIIKAKVPTICFSITENNMTAALWNYMRGIIGKSYCSKENKKQTIKKLDAFLKRI